MPPEQGVFAGRQMFPGRSRDRRPGCQSVETPAMFGAITTLPIDGRLAELSCGISPASMKPAIENDGAADARVDRQGDHVEAGWLTQDRVFTKSDAYRVILDDARQREFITQA